MMSKFQIQVQGPVLLLTYLILDHRSIGRGSVITNPGQWFHTSTFDAELAVLPCIEHEVLASWRLSGIYRNKRRIRKGSSARR